MRVVIFGAAGATGRHVVERALEYGHEVVAFVHGEIPEEFANRAGVTAQQGDAMDPEAVADALKGADAVISTLGHGAHTPPNMQTKSIENIIHSCQREGITRLISLTGSGVRTEGDDPGIVDRTLNAILRVAMSARIKDGIAHAQLIKESGLAWTIVRATLLTNGPWTGAYEIGKVRKGVRYPIARADVADFIVQQLDADGLIGEMPYISH